MLGEFAKYAFFGLKRKRRDFERSVLKYVSIKIPALTHSGRKRRVCVNAADRLLPRNKEQNLFEFSSYPQANHKLQRPTAHQPLIAILPFNGRHQKQVVESPSLYSPERSEGDGWCWTNLQNTHFSGLTRKNPAFERSVLMYVSIKNRILTPSGQKRRVCVNAADRLLPATKLRPLPCIS